MRLVRAFKEIFYFPFYFVSLNVAGFLSFVRFVQGSQPPMWEKGERVPSSLSDFKKAQYETEEEKESYEDKNLEYPKVSSAGARSRL